MFLLKLCMCVTTLGAEVGIASWYGEEHRGKLMANGRRFDPGALTCACWGYPFGTRLMVRRVDGRGRAVGPGVVVVVTDRGPARRLGRVVDLSAGAFRRLAGLEVGLVRVRVRVLR